MAIENKLATSLQIGTNYTAPSIADVDDDPDSPDGNWLVWDGAGNTTVRALIADPTSNPAVGVDLQEFRVQIRKSASGGNDPGWSLELWELISSTYTQVSVLATGTTTTLNPGEVISGKWNANLLTDPDGSEVLIALIQTSGATGNPSNQRGVEVGAFKWIVDLGALADQTANGSPSITPITAAGVAERIETADGSPSITPIEAAGTARQERSANGSPSITPVEAAGVAERIETADGSPSITPVEAAGVAETIRTADGSPSITPVEASGAAIGPSGGADQTADGSPSVTKFTASGNSFIWPRVYLNATETLVGATEMTVQSVAADGTSITFDDNVGFPTGSLFLGVENRNNGDVGWIAVTVAVSGPTVVFGSFGA